MFVRTLLRVLRLSVVILIPILLSVIVNVDGSRVSCPEDAIVDVTGVKLDGSGLVKKYDGTLVPNVTWNVGNETFGCACQVNTCLPLCCPPGMIRLPGRCEPDKSSPESLQEIKEFINVVRNEGNSVKQDYHLFVDDPCIADWTRPSIVDIAAVFSNGSIYAPKFDTKTSHDQYCLLWDPKGTKFVAKVCRTWVTVGNWEIFCAVISAATMLVIFIAYSVIPELKSSHGLIFRCFVATYTFGFVGLWGAIFTIELSDHPIYFTISVELIRFCSFSVVFWLNVMNFDMWRSFQNIDTSRIRDRTRKKFIRYAIYAWLLPIIMVFVVNQAATLIPFTYDDPGVVAFKHWITSGVVSSSFACNILLYFATARILEKFKKDTKRLASSSSKDDAVGRQWLKLHMKLLLLTGIHSIIWITWYTWPTTWMTRVYFLQEVLQSFLVFYIFLWKDDIKRSARKQFHEVLHSIVHIGSVSKEESNPPCS